MQRINYQVSSAASAIGRLSAACVILVVATSLWLHQSSEAQEQVADLGHLAEAGGDVASPDIAKFVTGLARQLASSEYQPPPDDDKDSNLTYDDYRKVTFDRERARWKNESHGFELHALPIGWLFKRGIDVTEFDGTGRHPLQFTTVDFPRLDKKTTLQSDDGGDSKPVPISGFRINGPLNSRGKSDEIIVFQGASYFRALAKGQTYGLSARGLAIATASPEGEEFPEFRKFWVEKPTSSKAPIIVHALLDSPSVAGAYRFSVTVGEETVVNVEAILYPRKLLENIGLAPLTSMNILSPLTPGRIIDFRPRVHDSQGLAIVNKNGERVWRPLSNPKSLQVSSFQGHAPKGFGLIQRQRNFESYQDLEARYERRPSVWIEPKGKLFEAGEIVLIEIPADKEWHDNIVAFWRPKSPIEPGSPTKIAYTLRWRADIPEREKAGFYVSETRLGSAHSDKKNALRFVIDYEADTPFAEGDGLPQGEVHASAGKIGKVNLQANPETGGLRASFVFQPEGTESTELRLVLSKDDRPAGETWLYRWTRGK